ncbi:MAG: Holliday junction branch migration protein RuvA [Candidatus Omnitrophota bacterium]|nr:OB-fold domain-containing protein [Candidatus Omnitrophota bacterium]
MISEINGRLKQKKDSSVILDVNGICYEVMIPPAVMKNLNTVSADATAINLKIYHYYQMDQSKAIPVLVGFLNDIERDFFEQFITVSGVGPKAACRALSLSFQVIAEAIDKGDIAFLKTLPGIGEQKAREIIAKLQGKVGKYCLMKDRASRDLPGIKEDIKEEALNVLVQLQYKKNEAGAMIEKAIRRNPKVSSCEEILNEVYKGSKI